MRRNIAIDARLCRTGIGTYIYNLIAGFRLHATGIALRGIVTRRDKDRLGPFCDEVRVVDCPIYSVEEQFAIPRAASGCALLHVPHYNAPLFYGGCLLVSICDLVHITEPLFRRTAASWGYARPMLNLAARKAAHIITLSEYSKSQIVERLDIPAAKISVIHCGVAPQFRPQDRQQCPATVVSTLSLLGPFALYVGNLKPHKNVSRLLRAFSILRDRKHDVPHLVIVGNDARWQPRLLRECRELRLESLVYFIPYVSEELLAALYSAAELLVLPSTLEGFGLPVIEAMACGTPVVCSNAASLPEVAGGAAEYFDPYSEEHIAAALEHVLSSNERRRELRQKGLERAARFSWEDCARQHAQIYRELLAS